MPLAIEGLGPIGPDEDRGEIVARIDVGLVNNMPDGALKATERQFARRLAAAAGRLDLRLHLFALDGVPRSAAARHHMRGRYGDLAALRARRLDALIVTGGEPSAPTLRDEPSWDGLARLVDWAESNIASTVWSCLAAHAAVLHLDGIARRRLPAKRFGLFECLRVADGGLFEGAPAAMRVPHSRWNDLAEGDLRRAGYRIASRSEEAGVDAFSKRCGGLFVFLQGHPEYDHDTLLREYRRDMRRFSTGAIDQRPALPAHCFDAQTAAVAEAAMRGGTQTGSRADEQALPLRPDLAAIWDASASAFFANWLAVVAAQR